jgi:hypothetical protein
MRTARPSALVTPSSLLEPPENSRRSWQGRLPLPAAPRYFVLGLACFGVLLVATGWPLLGAILAGVFGLVTAEFVRQNKVLHPVRSARYERKWICLACGHEWIAGEP